MISLESWYWPSAIMPGGHSPIHSVAIGRDGVTQIDLHESGVLVVHRADGPWFAAQGAYSGMVRRDAVKTQVRRAG